MKKNSEVMAEIAALPVENREIWKEGVGLKYEGELPTLHEMNAYDLIGLINDYSDYVQETVAKGKTPKTIDEFIGMSNLIFNAHMLKLTFEDDTYILDSEDNFKICTVIDVEFGEDGVVEVETDVADFLPGSIYKAPARWVE